MWFDWLIFESSIRRALDNQFFKTFFTWSFPRNIETICFKSFNRQGIHTSYLADPVPGPGNPVSQPGFRRQIQFLPRISIWINFFCRISAFLPLKSYKNPTKKSLFISKSSAKIVIVTKKERILTWTIDKPKGAPPVGLWFFKKQSKPRCNQISR